MRRRAVGVAVAAAAAVTASMLVGTPAEAQPGHNVLATGLDNPRQLNWSNDGKGLIVTQAGSGGPTCIGEGPEGPTCVGFTGKVGVIRYPYYKIRVAPKPLAEGLFSAAGPDGNFATGPDGADRTNVPGETISAITGIPPEARPPSLPPEVEEQLGHLVVSNSADLGENFSYFDFFAEAEEPLNPDKAQLDSNPYAVLFVNDKSGDGSGYALIADAAANTVWKIDPDYSACGDEDCVPPADLSVFYTWSPPSAPTTVDEPDIEYVPTSLASDWAGNIYVGGLGSLEPGKAKVTKFTAGGKKLAVWKGFTSVTGVAVRHGYLYVSQLFGGATGDPFAPDADPAGLLTRVNMKSGGMKDKVVPFPAGVAVDKHDNVYVAANSILKSGFRPGDTTRPSAPGGEIWRTRY